MYRAAVFATLLSATLSTAVLGQDANLASVARDKIGIKVLFAGDPGTERTKDFLTFLGRHFSQVRFADIEQHAHAGSAGHDVIILDSANYRTKTRGLSRDDGRPTILVGTFGGMLGSRWKLRTNWC